MDIQLLYLYMIMRLNDFLRNVKHTSAGCDGLHHGYLEIVPVNCLALLLTY